MSVETNKAVVLRFLEEFWNSKKLEVLEELVDPAFVNHDPSNPDVRNREDLKQFAITVATAFPDAHITQEDMIGEGDKVAKRWTLRGTHRGPFLGIAPTERLVEFTGTETYRIVNDKIVELWWNWDLLGLMKQLGAIPEMAVAGAR